MVENWNSANTVIFYGKDATLTGADREHTEVSMLALHLLQSALVHINTLLMQAVLEVPQFHDLIGEDERRALTPLFWSNINFYLDNSRFAYRKNSSQVAAAIPAKSADSADNRKMRRVSHCVKHRSAFRLPRRVATGGVPVDGVDITLRVRRRPDLLVPPKSGEGRYVASESVLDELEAEDRVVFRYRDNPNGSQRDIAGICSANRRVVGLMPHPEHATEALTGPSEDGLGLFYSALDAVLAA